MASPRTPAAPEGSTKSSGSLADFKQHLASQAGGSLPATPAKLAELDPAIILSVKSRKSLTAPKSPDFSQHMRNTSASSVVTVTKYNSRDTDVSTDKADHSKSAYLEGNWRNVNDPFVGSPEKPTNALTAALNTVSIQPKSTDGEDQDDEDTVGSPTPKPREDRDCSKISAENAQGFFKANSCIFVANLAASKSDEVLEADVMRVFSRYGDLWVKIRRDKSGMPYAFCQFTKESDATKALASGHGLLICGRPCRVERAKANRSVYLSRNAGGKITEAEARNILAKEGPLERLWYPTDTDKEVYRLSDGIWATFAFFQDARDAQTTFKESQEFRLEVPYSPEEHERKRISSFKFSPATTTPQRGVRGSLRWPTAGSRLGSNSIFIGNLPMSASIEAIRECLEGCGTIRTIEIVGKLTNIVVGYQIFAFVEFANDGGVRAAMASDIQINGRRLRIEPRESPENPSRSFSAAGSPRGRVPLTPRTPINSSTLAKTATTTPRAMAPIYEGNQQAQAQPQTPINPQMYNHAMSYSSPLAASPLAAYGYYSPNQGEAGINNVPSFVPLTGQQSMMGQYSIPGYLAAQYPPGPYSYGYVYPTPASSGSAAPNSNNQGNMPAQANPDDNVAANNGVSR